MQTSNNHLNKQIIRKLTPTPTLSQYYQDAAPVHQKWMSLLKIAIYYLSL